MENVTLTQKEQARLQVLNSLLAEHMTVEQAATLMGVSTRHTRRILAAYREEGAAALAHGPSWTPSTQRDARVAEVRGAAPCAVPLLGNQSHSPERAAQGARGHRGRSNHTAAHTDECRSEEPTPPSAAPAPCSPAADAPRGHAGTGGRQPPPVAWRPWSSLRAAAGRGRPGIVVNALFCEQENTRDYFLLMRGLIQRHGIPIALYTDRHSVFKNVPGSGRAGAPTQFSRAMDEPRYTDGLRPVTAG